MDELRVSEGIRHRLTGAAVLVFGIIPAVDLAPITQPAMQPASGAPVSRVSRDHAAVTAPQPATPLPPTPATRSIWIDKGHQRLYAFYGNNLFLAAPCSTAAHHAHYAPGDDAYLMPSTPLGSFRIFSKTPDHWSKAYEVHMRYALFYDGGRAIHATFPSLYRMLGRPASGGCIRLNRHNALSLYRWAHVGDTVHVVRSLPETVIALLPQYKTITIAQRPASKPTSRLALKPTSAPRKTTTLGSSARSTKPPTRTIMIPQPYVNPTPPPSDPVLPPP